MKDWTRNREGRANSSAKYCEIVSVVAEILRHHRFGDDVNMTARHIVSQLAHEHHFGPVMAVDAVDPVVTQSNVMTTRHA